MTLRHIEIFAMVCREGSITKAANRLHISQPTVSVAIKEMEGHYGEALFDRISHKLYLTPFGRRIYDYSLNLLNLYADMSEARQLYEVIRVGTGTAIGKFFLPKIIKCFSEAHPGIKVQANVGDATRIYHLVMQNDLDFAMAETVDDIYGLDHITIQKYPIVAVCHKDNPLAKLKVVSASDLAGQKLLLRESSSLIRQIVEVYFKSHNIDMNIMWVSYSVQSLFNATAEGLGISFHSMDLAIASLNPDLVILNIPDLKGSRFVNVSYHKDKVITQSMKLFLNYYQELTAAMLKNGISKYVQNHPDALFLYDYLGEQSARNMENFAGESTVEP